MKSQKDASSAAAAADDQSAETQQPGNPAEIIDGDELLRRVPVSRGTLRNWRAAEKIPFISLAGRRVLYHWPSVEAALLRHQRGGAS